MVAQKNKFDNKFDLKNKKTVFCPVLPNKPYDKSKFRFLRNLEKELTNSMVFFGVRLRVKCFFHHFGLNVKKNVPFRHSFD